MFWLGVVIMFGLAIDACLYMIWGIKGTISKAVTKSPPTLLMFVSFLLGHWTMPIYPDDPITKCKGCGSEYITQHQPYVDNCPQCPMSQDDLNKLIEGLKK